MHRNSHVISSYQEKKLIDEETNDLHEGREKKKKKKKGDMHDQFSLDFTF